MRIVSGAASRCDMHTLKTDRASRGIFGASCKQRRSCGHSNSNGRLQAPRRDRAWFRALAVSYVEFMRGLGEIIQRSSRNLKRAAVVEPRCRRGHKTKTPQWLRNQDVSAAAEARRRDKERLLGVRRSRSSRQATGRVNIKFGARLGSTKYRKFKEILPARGSQQKRRF